MTLTAQWTDADKHTVRVVEDGATRFVPADSANSLYASLVGTGVTIADAPAPSLDALKGAKGAALQAEYAARLGVGAAWNGNQWAITPAEAAMLDQVLAAIDRYGADKHDGTWTDLTGASVAVSAAQLEDLAEACFDRAAALGRVYAQHMGAILGAADATALDAVDITAGWPAEE